MRRVWLLLAIAGAIAPAVLTTIFIAEHGVDFGEFADQAYGEPMALIAWIDMTISALAFFVWVSQEGPRLGFDNWWLFILATLFIGLCFALPLFLYLRSGRLEAEGGAPLTNVPQSPA